MNIENKNGSSLCLFSVVCIRLLIALVVIIFSTSTVFATGILDWDTTVPIYPTGSFAHDYVNIGTPPVDISTTVTGDTGDLDDGFGTTPDPRADGLFFGVDYEDRSESVTLTINFSQPVSNVSFSIFDIDERVTAGGFTDEIIINASGPSGAVNPVITPDTVAPITYSVAGNVITGEALSDSDPTPITFDSAVTSITIIYSNGPGALANPTRQLVTVGDLSFEDPPAVIKQFSPGAISVGSVSTLTITLENNNTSAATLTNNLVDSLPAGVTVASPANIGGTCPGTTNAAVGSNTITYTSGSTIPVGGCAISVDVTSSTAGTVTNTIPADALQTDLGDNVEDASDNLTVNLPVAPTVDKSFSPGIIAPGAASALTITLGNANTTVANLTADLIDNLPAGVVVASPANIGGTCPGTTNAVVGGSTVTYTTGSVIPASGCTISVDVSGSTIGSLVNTIPINALQTDFGNNATEATDTLSIANIAAPTVTKTFSPTSINSGGTSQLTIALSNGNTGVLTLTSNLDDDLPVGVTATAVNGATNCPGAVDISTNTRVRYPTGAAIPSGGCNIVVDVTSNSLGVFNNTILIGDLQTDIGNNTSPTNASLTVTSGGGGGSPACPAGTNLVNLGTPRNATTATSTGNVSGTISTATGPVVAIGTGVAGSAFPRLNPPPASLTLGLADIVPLNSNILISLAQDNPAGVVDIQDSNDNASFSSAISFTGSNPTDDIVEHLNYSVATAAGAEFLRFTLTGGGFRVTGIEYSQICESIPQADLSIVKDDSATTFTPGGTSTYLLTVTNNGPDAVTSATIQDNLPNGVTLSGSWSCSASAGSSCSAASGGVVGGSLVSLTADILDSGVITVNVPVQFSADMSDF